MNIITAIGNQEINEKIKEETNINVIGKDIQYQEGVLEIIEKNGIIDILILNGLLPGEKEIEDFISILLDKNKILEIYIFLEKEEAELEKFLKRNGIKKIFYNNKVTEDELIDILKQENKKIKNEIELNEEINKLKEMILKKKENEFDIKKYFNNIFKIKKSNNKKTNKICKCTIITVLGNGGVGKSTFTIFFSKILKKENKKILIINLEKENSIKIFLGKLKKGEDEIEIKDKNIHIFSAYEMLNKINLKNIILEFSKKYDYILIDTNVNDFSEDIQKIINLSTSNILLVEPSLIGLKKSRILLEKYINKWKNRYEKINILFNKVNKKSISRKILENIFSDFKILGYVKTTNLIKEYKKIKINLLEG